MSGSFHGRGRFVSGSCAFDHTLVGDADWTGLGASAFSFELCTGFIPGGVITYPSHGTFGISTAAGTLSGTADGSNDGGGSGPLYPFAYELTVTEGTGRFSGATGTLTVEGAFVFSPAATADGDIAGTIKLPPPTPDSKGDCKRRGWKNFVDDNGKPFRSQGHCIRFVRRR